MEYIDLFFLLIKLLCIRTPLLLIGFDSEILHAFNVISFEIA